MTTESASDVLNRYYSEYEDDPDFMAEGMAIAIVEDALRIMIGKGLNRSNLATTMGVSKAQVSRLFNAPPNLTLRSIARLAVALGVKPFVCLDGGAVEALEHPEGTQAKTSLVQEAIASLLNSEVDRLPVEPNQHST